MAQPRYAPHFRGWRGPWTFASAEATAARLHRAGFEKVRTWLHDEPTYFDSRETQADFLKTVILRSHIAQLPHTDRDSFAEEVLTRAEAGGLKALDYVRLNLEARKPL
jgi:trans-aconitate 2-methyltransferase